ncbi:hypothetical protein JY651_04530 [Pyxidicoccus parkwayensis]|uniref:Uncharacterized protein n=1 Tax=Pyxidicoccus parkwayensis TaxID=2813578 RepID=A0ABX7NZ83_9BACT|nr:hypothetical protein [Pyxidicoccus parkwaysis]QSQ24236.1 hypothetical protein JY651_04530 [Pyxidicoccus parkwaysis]
MSRFKSGWLLGVPLLVLGSAAGGAYLYHHFREADWEHREAEYQRQLQGHLTENEKQIEAFNAQLGMMRSQLVTPADLEKKYTALLTARDADFEKFRQEHALVVKSLSNSILALQQRAQDGTEEAHEEPSPAPPPGDTTTPPAKPVISYAFADKDGRIHLTDPDIWVQGDEDLEMKQFFRVKGTVVQQKDGSLMAERIQLLEVSPDGQPAGQYRELAEASLVDASFTYANPPQEGPPGDAWVKWGPGWMATLGTSFRSEHLLRFGASASVVRLGDVGLAGGASSDFDSLEGTGGDAFVTYSPTIRGKQLGVALGGGVHLPLGGTTRVRPNVTLNFIVY